MKKLISVLFPAFIGLSVANAGDFDLGIPRPAGLSERDDSVRIMIIGDVMMHSRQYEFDHRTFLRDIAPEMSSADLCIANMEFPVAGGSFSGYPSFNAPEHIPEYVADCGVDIFLTANNHILDKGADGLTRTIDFYSDFERRTGTLHTGTGQEPLLVNTGEFRIAFINFTYSTNGARDSRVNYMSREQVGGMIESARKQGAEFIIALPHWGEEYHLRHSTSQEEWAMWLAERGVDAVVGSHPHVVQDTSHISGMPVVYSTGNAVSNMSATNTRLELAVTLTFVRDMRGKRMLEPQLDFLWCTLPGTLTESYSTIMIKKWANRRSDWLIVSDYDNMAATQERVLRETGISY